MEVTVINTLTYHILLQLLRLDRQKMK